MKKCNELSAQRVELDKSSYSVLIVEDSRFVNKLLYDTLSGFGYSCHQAFSLEDARKFLDASSYQLIVLDLHLPDGEGEELIRSMRSLTDTKIIVLTSDDDKQLRDHLYNYGILDYFRKDDQIAHTISMIDRLIETSEKNRSESILVVDDSGMVRRLLQTILEPRNYILHMADSGEKGLKILQEQAIDLVLLDMELPDMHGTKVLKKIKSNPELMATPVLVLSGTNDPNIISQVLKGGASDFIKKPFVTEELALKVDLWTDYHRNNVKVACQQQFLQEYKDAVDRSAIVSKTDADGNITYVNDRFIEISGYTKEEVIGKSHSIIRHPDMDAKVFEEMWKTILGKESWAGIVKNRKKNGDSYYVDTVISPIMDVDGRIVEFIGIRHDITEIEKIRRRLKEELNISELNFEEARYLSEQYEGAIDASTILSRTDLEGNYIYVNQQFLEISGYTSDELLGKPHELTEHPDTPDAVLLEMWETVHAGKVWKGALKKRSKEGGTFHVNAVLLPIKSAVGEIIEYMAIYHDITGVVQLHEELEATQKEVIHRMGEVGETRSKETGYHVKRVAEYSKLLALKVGLPPSEAELLYAASPMHDIGKVGIPDAILLKPGRLTEEEFDVMKGHCEMGYNILRSSERDILKAAAVVAHEHHERWDGKGYPRGLSGEGIHIYGRITAIADVFDALGSERVYKEAWELERILGLFKEERGKQFDPVLVDLFIEHLDEVLMIRDSYQDV